jgi:hypothetical protein
VKLVGDCTLAMKPPKTPSPTPGFIVRALRERRVQSPGVRRGTAVDWLGQNPALPIPRSSE